MRLSTMTRPQVTLRDRCSSSCRYGSRQGRTDSGGGLARTSSETEGGGGGYTHPRRRAKDDLGHDAHVTLVEPGT